MEWFSYSIEAGIELLKLFIAVPTTNTVITFEMIGQVAGGPTYPYKTLSFKINVSPNESLILEQITKN